MTTVAAPLGALLAQRADARVVWLLYFASVVYKLATVLWKRVVGGAMKGTKLVLKAGCLRSLLVPGSSSRIPGSGKPWAATHSRRTCFASVVGAFMSLATLTEVPILQKLIHSGMGKGLKRRRQW